MGNEQTKTPTPDTAKLAFVVTVRTARYGDGKAFPEYRILFKQGGQVVGAEDGPSRKHATPRTARLAGKRRVAELRTRRLYVVRVTDEHIDAGEARSCSHCAIAQALWDNQDRMGFPRDSHEFDVEPYGGMFVDCHGIVIRPHEWDAPDLMTGVDGMPDVVVHSARHGYAEESMLEWAMRWDDYADARGMTLDEWREDGHEDDEDLPDRPPPCSFVLDLDAMKSEELAEA